MDIETIAVAALPGLIFGGINIYTLLKFSYNLGKYQGEEGSARNSLGNDVKEIKSDVSEIRADVKANAQQYQSQQLEMQANSLLLKYLQGRDKELGERTHKIANLEMALSAVTETVRSIQNQLTLVVQRHS